MRDVPRVGAVVAAALLSAFAGSCGSRARTDRTLVAALRADATGIFPNPPIQAEGHTLEVNAHLFEGLTKLDRSLGPVPALAASWVTLDEKTWRFDLRPGAVFSDGRPVTPRDVVASLEAALHNDFTTRQELFAIDTIREASPQSVEITTKWPTPLLAAQLPAGFVLPADSFAKSPVPPIGTGPFVLESRAPGRETVLRRNARYRGPAPDFERVRLVIAPDAAERLRRLEAGEADFVDHVPLDAIDRLAAKPGITVVARPGLRVFFLAFRVDRPPFDDVRLRRAVDLALDREELVRRALRGKTVVASQLVPPTVAGHDPEIASPVVDRDRARRLLAEAGHPGGFEVTLDGPNDRYVNDVEVLGEVARQLAEVGIRVRVNAVPKAAFYPLLTAGTSSFYLLGYRCTTLESGSALLELMRSPRPEIPRSLNTQGLADAELDRRIDEAVGALEPSRRLSLLRRAMRRVHEIQAVAPLAVQPESVAFSKSVAWDPPLNFALRFDEMRDVPDR